jgi:hypothetical protein
VTQVNICQRAIAPQHLSYKHGIALVQATTWQLENGCVFIELKPRAKQKGIAAMEIDARQ